MCFPTCFRISLNGISYDEEAKMRAVDTASGKRPWIAPDDAECSARSGTPHQELGSSKHVSTHEAGHDVASPVHLPPLAPASAVERAPLALDPGAAVYTVRLNRGH